MIVGATCGRPRDDVGIVTYGGGGECGGGIRRRGEGTPPYGEATEMECRGRVSRPVFALKVNIILLIFGSGEVAFQSGMEGEAQSAAGTFVNTAQAADAVFARFSVFAALHRAAAGAKSAVGAAAAFEYLNAQS